MHQPMLTDNRPVVAAGSMRISSLIRLALSLALAGLFLCSILFLAGRPTSAQGSIAISKTVSGTVKAGAPFTYTIYVQNTTGVDIVGSVSDELPAGVSLVSYQRVGGENVIVADGVITWTSIQVQDSSTVSRTFVVTATTVGQAVNSNYSVKSGPSTFHGDSVATTIIPGDPHQVLVQVAPGSVEVGSSSTITIALADAYGNPITASNAVTLNFSKGYIDGLPAGTTISGNTSGGYLVKTITDTVIGTAYITASISTFTANASVNFTAGPPATISVGANPVSITANGEQISTITASVQDRYTNPVATTPITFSATNSATLNAGSAVYATTTNAQGVATVVLSGTTAGTATVTVQAGSVSGTQKVRLTAGPAAYLNLQATPASIGVANDGSSTSTVTLNIHDRFNNPIETATQVTMTTSLGTFQTCANPCVQTVYNGVMQQNLVAGTEVGSAVVHAVIDQGLGANTSVAFTPGPAHHITMVITPSTLVANGSSVATLTTIVRDAFENPINSAVNIGMSISAGNLMDGVGGVLLYGPGTLTQTSNITGTRAWYLQSSTSLITSYLTATVAGLSSPVTGQMPFVVGPPYNARLSINPAPPLMVGTTSTLTVTVYDQWGHVVPSAPITMTSWGGTGFSPSSTGATNINGQLARVIYSYSAVTDTVSVLSALGDYLTTTQVAYFPDSAVQATLTASQTTLYADGEHTATITATVKDRYGNPIVNYTPAFTYTHGTLTGEGGATNIAGVATRTLQSSVNLETSVISVSGLLTVTPVSVQFVVGPVYTATMTALPTTPVVNTTPVNMVITLTDKVGHLVTNRTVAVTSTIGTPSGGACFTSDAQGRITCALSSTQSGSPQVYVDGVPVEGATIEFVPDATDRVIVTPTGTSGSPVNVTAGIGTQFTATAYDQYGNAKNDVGFSWMHFTTGDGGDGEINASGFFTGTTVGVVFVQAVGDDIPGQSFVKVNVGPATQANIIANPLTLPADGGATSQLTFQVKDKYGNRVGAGVNVFAVTDRGIIGGSGQTDSNGVTYRTIRSSVAGLAHLNVTNLVSVTGNTVVTFTAGTPNKAIITPTIATLYANGVDQSTLRITIVDQYNNPVSVGYAVDVLATLGEISNNTGVTDENGVVTATLTAPYGVEYPPQSVPFTIRANSVGLSIQGSVIITVGSLSTVVVTPNNGANPYSVRAGRYVTFTAQGFDAYGAPIPTSANLGYFWTTVNGTGTGALLGSKLQKQAVFSGTTNGSVNLFSTLTEQSGLSRYKSLAINVRPAPPVAGTMAIDPVSVEADTANMVTYTLSGMTDAFSNLADNGDTITLTLHSQPAAQVATSVISGQKAAFVVPATTKTGVYTLSAASESGPMSLLGTTSVTFIPGPPAQAQVLTAPVSLVANNTDTGLVVIQLQDKNGNSVLSGVAPVLTSTRGVLTGSGNTDANGLVTRTLRSDYSLGSAIIYVNGFAATGYQIPFVPGPAVSAVVTNANPLLVVGGHTTPVIFDVRDAWSHPVTDSTVITPTLNPALGYFTGTLQTNDGLVTLTLVTSNTAGSAAIQSQGLTVSGNTGVTVVPDAPYWALVSATPPSRMVGLNATIALTVTVTDQYSNPVPSTAMVMTSTLGVLDSAGSTITRTTLANTGRFNAVLTSTTAGTATFTFRSPSGPVTLNPASPPISFTPDEPVSLTLEPSGPLTLRIGVVQVITASSRDQYGNAVDIWTPVEYTWWQDAVEGSAGYSWLIGNGSNARSVSVTPQVLGNNRMWASGGGRVSPNLSFTVTPGYPDFATVALSADTVPADGATPFTMTLTDIWDEKNNPIPDGTAITLTVNATPPVIRVATIAGNMLVVPFTSSTKAGVHAITAMGEGKQINLSGATVITFTPGVPYKALVEADDDTLPADGVSSTAVRVTVRDMNNNLVANDTPITLTTSLGTISGDGTTVNGVIVRTLTAPTRLGSAVFTVRSAGGMLYHTGDSVTFAIGEPNKAQIPALPVKVVADGISTATLVITITDVAGFTVLQDKTAVISVTRGSVSPATITAVNGVLTTTFTANTSVGPVSPTITYGGVPMLVVGDPLEQVPGAPVSATVTTTQNKMMVGSAETADLTFTFRDDRGRLIDNGSVVTVTTTRGAIVSNSSTTVNGVVTRVLTPGVTTGWVTPTAVVRTPRGETVTLTPIFSPTGASIQIVPSGLDHLGIRPVGPTTVVAGKTVTLTAYAFDYLENDLGYTNFKWERWYGYPKVGDGTLFPAANRLAQTAVFTALTAGQIGIRAFTDTTNYMQSNMFELTILPGNATTATVSANPKSILVGGEESQLVITVRDAYGNLVSDGVTVTLESNIGSVSPLTGTTVNGQITCTFKSDSYLGDVDIIVNTLLNGIKAAGDHVRVNAGSSVTPAQSTLLADGLGKTTLTIVLFDPSQPTPPVVTATLGMTVSGTTGFIDAERTTYTRTLQASKNPGVAAFFVNGLQAQGVLTLTTGPAVTVSVRSDAPLFNGAPALTADGVSTTTLTLTQYDVYSHVVTATTPSLFASRGTLGPVTQQGDFFTAVLTSGTTYGRAALSATGLAVTGQSSVWFVGQGSANITAYPSSLPADGLSLTILTVQLFGPPPASPPVVASTLGLVNGNTGFFDADKTTYTRTLRASTQPGTATFTVGGLATQGAVPMTVGPAATARISATTALRQDGLPALRVVSSTTLTITLYDEYNHVITDSTALDILTDGLTTTLGTLGDIYDGLNGVFTTTLTTGDTSGRAIISVDGLSATGASTIWFIGGVNGLVTPAVPSLIANGADQTVLTIDLFGPAKATPPVVTATLGVTISGSTGFLPGTTTFTRTVRASTTIGSLSFFVDGLPAQGDLTLTVGPVVRANFDTVAPFIEYGYPALRVGQSTVLTITQYDAFGHTVTDVVPSVLTTRGNLGAVNTGTGGVFTTTLTATAPGKAHLSVTGVPTFTGKSIIWLVGEDAGDGSFETGDLSDWTLGGIITGTGGAPVYTATVLSGDVIRDAEVTPFSGSKMLRLGATTVFTDLRAPHKLSEAWVRQPIQVPATGIAQIQFQYRMLSYDVAVGSATDSTKEYDPFEIFIDGKRVARQGITWSSAWQTWYAGVNDTTNPQAYPGETWQQVNLDVTPYAGQRIWLEFRQSNRQIPANNTWTYIDGVRVITSSVGPAATAHISSTASLQGSWPVVQVGRSAVLTVTVSDAYGHILTDTTPSLSTSLGTLGPVVQVGDVFTTLLTAGTTYGQAIIAAEGLSVTGQSPIWIVGVGSAGVTATPPTLLADGVSKAMLTITLFNPFTGSTPPVVTPTLGKVSGSTGFIDAQKTTFTRTLQADITPGVAAFLVGGSTADGVVTMTVGPAIRAVISATTSFIEYGYPALVVGHSAVLTVTQYDSYSHTVPTAPPTLIASRGELGPFNLAGQSFTAVFTATSPGKARLSLTGVQTVTGVSTIWLVGEDAGDGGFETGGLGDWTLGGIITGTGGAPVYTATVLGSDDIRGVVVRPAGGNQMLRLGATAVITDLRAPHKLSEAWVRQPIQVPAIGLTQLQFKYRMLSYDVAVGSPTSSTKEYDPFEFFIDGKRVSRLGLTWSSAWQEWSDSLDDYSQPKLYPGAAWQQVNLDVTEYAGERIWLEFRQSNRQIAARNTWTYIDEVKVVNVAPAKAVISSTPPLSLGAEGRGMPVGSSMVLTITLYDAFNRITTSATPTLTTPLGVIGPAMLSGNIFTAVLTATMPGKAIISVAGVPEVVSTPVWFVGSSVADGGFESESGGIPTNNWVVRGNQITTAGAETYPVYTVTVLSQDNIQGIAVAPFKGTKMLRLGASTTSTASHKISEAWVRQPIYFPPSGLVRVRFSYRMLTYEQLTRPSYRTQAPAAAGYDPFEVFVAGTQVFTATPSWTQDWQDWYNANTGQPWPYPGAAWQSVSSLEVPVTPDTAGKAVWLEFRQSNRDEADGNTWTYLDEIEVVNIIPRAVISSPASSLPVGGSMVLTITLYDADNNIITGVTPDVTTTRGTIGSPVVRVGNAFTTILTATEVGVANIGVVGMSTTGATVIRFMDEPIIDGGFEPGNLDGWTVGGAMTGTNAYPAYTATVISGDDLVRGVTVTPAEGDRMVRLGATTATTDPHKISEAWIRQLIDVPAAMEGDKAQVQFKYRMLSYDVAVGTQGEYDPFEVFVDGKKLLREGPLWSGIWQSWYNSLNINSSPWQHPGAAWQQINLDIPADCAGRQVWLEFRQGNRRVAKDNTWTYIDEVKVVTTPANPLIAQIRSTATVLGDDGLPVLPVGSSTVLTITLYNRQGQPVTNIQPVLGSTLGKYGPVVSAGNAFTVVLTATVPGKTVLSIDDADVTGVSALWFVGNDVGDGSFESADSADLSNWQLGGSSTATWNSGSYPVYTVTVLSRDDIRGITVNSYSGNRMLRLGATTATTDPHKISDAWVRQPIWVPEASGNGRIVIQFRYRMLSYDVAVGSVANGSKEYDPFEVYIDGTRVFTAGATWSQEWQTWYNRLGANSKPKEYPDSNWQLATIDVTKYVGQRIWLEFRQANRTAPVDNTWTYIDEVKILGKRYYTFLPLVVK